MGLQEIVHIIPLGYEIDRAVKPFEWYKANRVYLLVTPADPKYKKDMNDLQDYFNGIVKRKIEEKGIKVKIEEVDLFDVKKVMKSVSRLVREEKTIKNNIVYVNMSAAGKLTAMGTTLAAMVHGAKVYYVMADGYPLDKKEQRQHGLGIVNELGIEEKIVELPNFTIVLPSETGKIVMTHLFEKNAPMTTKEIVEILIEKGDTRFKDITKSPPSNRPPPTTKEKQRNLQLNLNILNKVILNRLEDSGYITRKRVGKYNQIVITPSGEYVASIIGTMK